MKRNEIVCTAIGAFLSAVSFLAPTQACAAAGDLDTTFGRTGVVRTDFSGTDEYGFAVKVQSDGKALVGGQSGVYPVFHAALARNGH